MAVKEGSGRSGVQRYATPGGEIRWRIRWEPPAGPDGKRRQGSRRGFSRQADAKEALREVLADLGDGTYVPADRQTVGEWLQDEWLPMRKPDGTATRSRRRQLSLSAWSQYDTYIRAYVVPHIGHLRLQELNTEHLYSLYDHLDLVGGRRGNGL